MLPYSRRTREKSARRANSSWRRFMRVVARAGAAQRERERGREQERRARPSTRSSPASARGSPRRSVGSSVRSASQPSIRSSCAPPPNSTIAADRRPGAAPRATARSARISFARRSSTASRARERRADARLGDAALVLPALGLLERERALLRDRLGERAPRDADRARRHRRRRRGSRRRVVLRVADVDEQARARELERRRRGSRARGPRSR